MKLISQETLLKEIRRHIPAKHFDFAKKHVEPYVRVYRTDSTDNKNQYRLYDEETYNMIVNTAIRARKVNPSSLEDALKIAQSIINQIGGLA